MPLNFCRNCYKTFELGIIDKVWNVKGLGFCNSCYIQIQSEHKKRGIEWKGRLVYCRRETIKENPNYK